MKVIEIEATNLCNAACLMCPREQLTRPRGRMAWDTFRTIADKALAFGRTEGFNFSGIGEPLLHRDLPRFVAYVSPHARTYLTTNGALLDEATIDGLLEAGLGSLTVSFNGDGPESYERIMARLDFAATEAAIRRLVDRARGRLLIQANVAVSNLTRPHLPGIKARLAELGIEHVFYSLCHSRGGSLRDEGICHYYPPPPTGRCDILVDNTFVAWNGLVLACCQDVTGSAVLGDLAVMSMQELAAIRARILEKGVDFAMCAQCDDIYRCYHDDPPPGATLSEWIYRLYESEDARTAALTAALRGREAELARLEAENARLAGQVAAYERGRFMRLMRWIDERRRRWGG